MGSAKKGKTCYTFVRPQPRHAKAETYHICHINETLLKKQKSVSQQTKGYSTNQTEAK